MTIRLRILLACLTLAGLTASLGLFTLNGEQRLGAIALRMYDASFMSVDFFRAAETGFAELHARVGALDLRDGPQRHDTTMHALASSIVENLDVAIERATSDAARQTATDLRNRVVRLDLDATDIASTAGTLDATAPLFERGAEQFAQDGFQARLQAEQTAQDSKLASEIAIAASSTVALLITLVLSRSIVRPLRRATSIASEIAEGNLDNAIDARGTSEISMLMKALRIMQSALTERRAAARRIEYMARHDALTDLANRVAFASATARAVEDARDGVPFALLLLDLDRFKSVNDTFGHPVGDGLLRAVASRLRLCVREGDTVARLGGDEFAVVQRSGGTESSEQLARRLVEALSAPYQISGHTVSIGVSVGIALSSADCTAEEMHRNSDVALYEAKNAGRGTWRLYRPVASGSQRPARVTIHGDFRRHDHLADPGDRLPPERIAFDRAALVMLYAPVLDLETNRVVAFEAQPHWPHPDIGLITMSEMAATALPMPCPPIGEWALRQSCNDAAGWPSDIAVSVSIEAGPIVSGDLAACIEAALGQSGLPPHRLIVHVPDSLLASIPTPIFADLARLRDLGVTVMSKLAGGTDCAIGYLRDTRVGGLRLHETLIAQPTSGGPDFVAGLISLARRLGLTTLADGVTDENDFWRVHDLHCSHAQGPFIGLPARASEIASMLDECAMLPHRASAAPERADIGAAALHPAKADLAALETERSDSVRPDWVSSSTNDEAAAA